MLFQFHCNDKLKCVCQCGAILLTEHIYLMSRMVMADRQMFLQLMAATATPTMTEAKLYDGLLDRWWGTVSFGDQ